MRLAIGWRPCARAMCLSDKPVSIKSELSRSKPIELWYQPTSVGIVSFPVESESSSQFFSFVICRDERINLLVSQMLDGRHCLGKRIQSVPTDRFSKSSHVA